MVTEMMTYGLRLGTEAVLTSTGTGSELEYLYSSCAMRAARALRALDEGYAEM